jgi:hypothetical protein
MAKIEKPREQMRSVITELLLSAEMARTEGTVDTVELNRNQSCSQALSRMRVPKRKEHHAELRSATLMSTKSGHWEQFAAVSTNRRHQQSPCPLTPTVPSVRAISAFGNRSGKLYGPIWPGFRVTS